MSGGKGGSSTSSTEVPQYVEDAARRNLAMADRIAQTGPVTYRGPDIAAFTPMQMSSFQNTGDIANAFGMASPSDMSGGLGLPTEYANGVRGYSAAPIYDQAMDAFALASPAQKSYIDSFFINPQTGEIGTNSAAGQSQINGQYGSEAAPFNPFVMGDSRGGNSGDGSFGRSHMGGGGADLLGGGADRPQHRPDNLGGGGGYDSFRVMVDGGGPGESGGDYSGGGRLSDIANAVAGRG